MELTALISLPEVIQVAIADEAGRLLSCAGDDPPPTTAVLVLAQATLSAASELGRRSGSGDCLEIIQQHDAGIIYLHSLSQRQILLVRCHSTAVIPTLRAACQGLATPVAPHLPPVTSPTLNLSDALHAEPAW